MSSETCAATGIFAGDLARYLDAGAAPASEHVRRATERDALFVVTAVLTNPTLAIATDRRLAEELEVQVQAIAGETSVSLAPAASQEGETVVAFTGSERLASGSDDRFEHKTGRSVQQLRPVVRGRGMNNPRPPPGRPSPLRVLRQIQLDARRRPLAGRRP